jgi:hypothetical protein
MSEGRFVCVVASCPNVGPQTLGFVELAAQERSGNEILLSGRQPVKGNDLVGGQPDEGIAAAQRVIQECEGVVAGKGGEPEGQFRQINGNRVSVDSVEATMGNEPSSVEEFIGIRRYRWDAVMRVPCVNKHIRQLTARFDQESP